MAYCDDCIHNEVCGVEDALDPSMTYCGDKKTIRELIDKIESIKHIEYPGTWRAACDEAIATIKLYCEVR